MKQPFIFLASLSLALASCSSNGDFLADKNIDVNAPAKVIVSDSDGVESIYSSQYSSIKRKSGAYLATADVAAGSAIFHFKDVWQKKGDELLLGRFVIVEGNLDGAGFNTEISLTSNSQWEETQFLIPGIIYGQPHTSASSKGGSMYHDAGFFSVREDYMAAPLIAAMNQNGEWTAILNPEPDGYTTQEETTAGAEDRIVDAKLAFGALSMYKTESGLEMKFTYPGTCEEFLGRGFFQRDPGPAKRVIRGRYHPVSDGFVQKYLVKFRTGQSESMPEFERTNWRWAWDNLDPECEPVDVDEARTTLLDHLQDRVVRYEGRAGIPFVIDAKSGLPGSFRPAMRAFPGRQGGDNKEIIEWAGKLGIEIDPSAAELNIWPWAVVGFCGKHVELAGQFLRESYRDDSERGAAFRKTAEEIMNTLVTGFPVNPPIGEGLDLRTGIARNIHGGNAFGIRPIAEDMSMLMELLKVEKEHGITHEDWLAWGKSHAEWLLTLQREDGTFPADWGNDGQISDANPEKTYAPIPFFTRLTAFTGEQKWLDAAVRAGDALWKVSGQKGVYCGATGSTQVADKESGMLSLNAFLSLYEATNDKKWLDMAVAAGDYTESWIWIWNVPMPEGADPDQLGWKPGVPTTGVNGIGSNDVGGVDQYLDWAVPLYAALYKYTGDEHYYDVAYILLHGTKAMLALPGRTYDLAGPGWQQEHWRMGPVRGIGAHRTWLPWISINHLHGITGLEDFDKDLYERMKK